MSDRWGWDDHDERGAWAPPITPPPPTGPQAPTGPIVDPDPTWVGTEWEPPPAPTWHGGWDDATAVEPQPAPGPGARPRHLPTYRGDAGGPGRPDDGSDDRRRRRLLAVPLVVVVLCAALFAVTRLTGSEGGDAAAVGDDTEDLRGDALAHSPTTTASTTTTTSTTVAPTTTTPPTTAAPAPPPPPPPAPRPPARSTPKKGVGVWDFPALGPALADVQASWYYNWSAGPTGGAGDAAEFVPMIWGARSVNAQELDRARASGDVLLGFNEPDFEAQSNMSVEQALDLWPQLEATGLRLGSPAVAVNGAEPGGWLDRFISGARDRGLRVDFIALHWYGGDFGDAAVGHLRSYIEAVHDRYGLPIWLTEYSLIRWDGGGAHYPTDAELAAFATNSAAMLESLPYVERYAWFGLPTPDEAQGTGLYRDDGSPTAAGTAYRAAG